MQSLLDAGLSLIALAKHRAIAWQALAQMIHAPARWALPEGPDRLPLAFSIAATKRHGWVVATDATCRSPRGGPASNLVALDDDWTARGRGIHSRVAGSTNQEQITDGPRRHLADSPVRRRAPDA